MDGSSSLLSDVKILLGDNKTFNIESMSGPNTEIFECIPNSIEDAAGNLTAWTIFLFFMLHRVVDEGSSKIFSESM